MAVHARGGEARGRGMAVAVLVVAAAAVVLALLVVLAPTAGDQAAEDEPGDAEVVEPSAAASESEPGVSAFDELLASGGVTSIRLIGDSITAGFLCDGYGVYPDDTSVVAYDGPEGTYYETSSEVRCWANDFRAYATERGVESFVNAGVSGFRMQYLAESPESWLGEGADAVFVMLGTNDACHCSLEEFREYSETALAAASERCRVLVVVSPPDNARTDASSLYGMDEVDAVLSEVCAEHGWLHVSLLDALELGTSDYNPDQCHPTTSGSDKLWEALKSQIVAG